MKIPEPASRTPAHKAARAAVRQLEGGTVRTVCLLGDPDDICAPAVAFHAIGSHFAGNRYGAPWCDMHAAHMGIPDQPQMECVEKAPVVAFYRAHGYVETVVLEDFVTLVLSRHQRNLQTIVTSRHASLADLCNWLVTGGVARERVVALYNLFRTPEAIEVGIFSDDPPALPAHA